MGLNEFKNIKLLYVEDEHEVRQYAMSYFKRIFENVYESSNAINALEIFKKENPHIIITDIKMDDISGIELIKEIRKIDKNCQVIVLSAFLDTQYLLEAIELNLVKYLTKPIDHEELYSVLLQCVKNIDANKLIHFTSTSYYNESKKILYKDGLIMKLNHKELTFIELLSKNRTRVVSYEEIENIIWFENAMSENALRTLVKRIRKKLPDGCLENVSKYGYKLRCL